MKLLFIAQTFPYPSDTGSRNLIFHWLDAASRANDVHLLWMGDSAQGKEGIPGLPRVRVSCIEASPAMEMSARIRRFAEAVAIGIPPTSLAGMTRAARNEILRHVRADKPDLVVLAENVVAGYSPILAAYAPVVLFKHSVQAVDARDERRRHGMWHPRWILEEWMARRFEAKTCHAAKVVCTVNAEDAADLAQRYRLPRPAKVVSIGVDLSQFPNRDKDPGGQVIGFFGNLTWGANIDAVRWFANEIMPKVSSVHPDAMFRVIGGGGEDLRKNFSSPHLEFTGRVTSIPEAMADVAVGVVPVVTGTGIRFKLLEMLSMGIPTVTTSLGNLGTGCVHGEHVLIADDADGFAHAVNALLSDSSLRAKLSREASVIAKEFSWEEIFEEIRGLIQEAVSKRETVNVD
jgi:glycosyltransferase involved in cell wall biosynthesis